MNMYVVSTQLLRVFLLKLLNYWNTSTNIYLQALLLLVDNRHGLEELAAQFVGGGSGGGHAGSGGPDPRHVVDVCR